MSFNPPKLQNRFTPKAIITSDEVMVFHDFDDKPIVGSRQKQFHVSMPAAGPLEPYLALPGGLVYPRESGNETLKLLRQRLDDPALPAQLQNGVAAAAFIASLPKDIDIAALTMQVAAHFDTVTPLHFLTGDFCKETSKHKAPLMLKGLLSYLGEHTSFGNTQGSFIYQKALQDIHSKLAGEKPSYAERLEQALTQRRWLPCSNGPYTETYTPLRLEHVAHCYDSRGQRFVMVSSSKFKAAQPMLHVSAREYLANSMAKLIEVRKATGISKAEFCAPMIHEAQAQGLINTMLEACDAHSIGGKMVRKALSNPELYVTLVNRSNVTDYLYDFDHTRVTRALRRAGGVAGFSATLPFVYVGGRDKKNFNSIAVEELVHHAFGLLYDNQQRTYARQGTTKKGKPLSQEQIEANKAFAAQKDAYDAAVQRDMEDHVAMDFSGDGPKRKWNRAVQKMREDFDMPEELYKPNSFSAELATKIIVAEALGESTRSFRAWPHVMKFVHESIGKDVDDWVARGEQVGSNPAIANKQTGSHVASISDTYKPRVR